jgi:hypothetical protein
VEIPGFDAPNAARRFGGVRGARSESARTGRRGGVDGEDGTPAADDPATGEAVELSSIARRHLVEGSARLHDVGSFEPITDADTARTTARAVRRRLLDNPRQGQAAQANVSPATVQRALG